MTDTSNLDLLAFKNSLLKTELPKNEVVQRLSLYQVFLKLYEQHKNLLDEILQLEHLPQSSLNGFKPLYIQGIIDNFVVCIMTNLHGHKTETLLQSQNIWTIGRASSNGIQIFNKHISRHHAAIQYIKQQGFYLINCNSSNGCYVNGEPIYQSTKLEDGDRIRLASLSFTFYQTNTTHTLPNVELESFAKEQKLLIEDPNTTVSVFRQAETIEKESGIPGLNLNLILEQQSEILDTFLNKHN